jgi:hypothetical protein
MHYSGSGSLTSSYSAASRPTTTSTTSASTPSFSNTSSTGYFSSSLHQPLSSSQSKPTENIPTPTQSFNKFTYSSPFTKSSSIFN